MNLNLNLATKIEEANASSHRSYVREGNYLSLSSGGVFYGGPDDFFSQVVGWGFNDESGEIEKIEKFYRAKGCQAIAIEISSMANSKVLNKLLDRGYRISEINNVSALERFSCPTVTNNFEVVVCKSNLQKAKWAKVVSQGFSLESYEACFGRYAQTKEVTVFAAKHDNTFLGGGAVSIHNGVADLGMASTLQEHRGKGIQKKLLIERISFAMKARANLAIVITEPGSISDNNVRKLGFTTLYSRFKLERGIKDSL